MLHHQVLQFVECWLPQSMVWMHEQLLNLPPQFVPHVTCNERANVDQFAMNNIHLTNQHPLISRLRKIIAYRLGGIPFDFCAENLAKHIGASLIHSHFGNVAWMNLRTASRLMVPHLVSFYGFDVRSLPTRDPVWRKRYRRLFSEVELVLAMGPNMAWELETLGCGARKIRIHHLGVDLTHLPFRPRHPHANQPLRILMAGTFKEKKGIPCALEALHKLRGHVDLEITIIGDATDDYRDQLEKKRIIDTVRRLKLESIVKLLGYQPYSILIKEAYSHDIFLAPSLTANDGDKEGIPMTIVEMAASGMPIVSTVHADIPEIIQHGITGWLAKENCVDELVTCLQFVISNPEKWLPALKAGREHIEKQFDAYKQGIRLGDIYQQLI
ncbi:MAG: glycosyltransferase [Deltaproteobacteria bacterium]|nr:glycosyltransferase [Deltaproteobacteria bacterium]